jgi:hypothetical protein
MALRVSATADRTVCAEAGGVAGTSGAPGVTGVSTFSADAPACAVPGAPGAILSRLSTRLASSEAMAVSIPFMPFLWIYR